MTDYSFMRSGLGMGVTRDPAWSAEDWQIVKSALLVFVEEAMVLSARYARIQGRASMTADDLLACLKVQTQRGLRGLQQAHQADERMAAYRAMLAEDEEDEDEDEHDEDEEDEHDEDEEDEDSREQHMPHVLDVLNDEQLCAIVDLAEQNWDRWTPTDRMEQILKQAVQQTAEQFRS